MYLTHVRAGQQDFGCYTFKWTISSGKFVTEKKNSITTALVISTKITVLLLLLLFFLKLMF